MSNFHVALKKVVDDSYDVQIGCGLIDDMIQDIKEGLVGNKKKFAVITDSNVDEVYGRPVLEKILAAGYQGDLFVFAAGEKSKVRKTKEEIEDAMLAKGYRRDCCVIAVGGGVVTDLAGFLAGTFGRGVPVIHYATTLLAAADASIGGKTAVDTDLATNLIGLIYQPKKVYVDIDAWKTLPKRHLINGLAETIKHACLADYELFTYLEEHWQDILSCDKEACTYISEHNCKVKYEVVMKDEKENNLREILNLGHTVGRAIETVSDYRLLHGEALSIGMTAQVLLGYRSGYLSKKDREELVKKLYTDKKVRDGRLRFVFQKGIGEVMTFGEETYARCVSEEEIRAVLMDNTVL